MISFWAEVAPTDNALQFGDAGRIEIWSKPTNEDLAAAMGLLKMLRKVLRLRFSLPNEENPICEFSASIAPINSSLRFKKRAKIKFDIPETEIISAARLISYSEGVVMRIEVEAGDKLAKKEKSAPKASVGSYGAFWDWLVGHQGFMAHPDLSDFFSEEASKFLGTNDRAEMLRRFFKVQSRSEISPGELKEALAPLSRQSSVWIAIERAEQHAKG
jgi:hypothetical protein